MKLKPILGCLVRLTGLELSGSDLAARLIQLGLYLDGKFKLVFKIILNPFAQRFDLRPAQPGNRGFNFLNCAHWA